ncbi:transposase, partial [Enterocloster citroniae]|uniref:transposase n=1 Tax=Enterocloster citroniae TaxID=358743 RepID=UPI003A7F1894
KEILSETERKPSNESLQTEKKNNGMRYTQYRGLAKVTMELTLLFACMNLKKLAIWKWRKGGLRNPCSFVWIFEPIYLYIKFKMVPGASHQEPFCLQSEAGPQWALPFSFPPLTTCIFLLYSVYMLTNRRDQP